VTEQAGTRLVLPRDIDETPLEDPDSAEKPGYLMPEPENDQNYSFTGAPERLTQNKPQKKWVILTPPHDSLRWLRITEGGTNGLDQNHPQTVSP
jgi:hypothetical protein